MAYRPPVNQSSASAESVPAQSQASSVAAESPTAVDKVVATNIASSLAESTDMPISNNIANLSQSLAVESVLGQTDTNVISKPQIVQPTASGQSTQEYIAVSGDNAASVAQKFGISSNTLRWANNLTSDALEPGRKLTILPADGILYTVKAGDDLGSISQKYGGSIATIVAYNNLELSGTPIVGSKIFIANGILPEVERPGYIAPRSSTGTLRYSNGYGSSYSGVVSAGNKYAWGNCTWYAYERRQQLGMPVGSFWGNANTWDDFARAAGLLVNGSPAVGAIMQNDRDVYSSVGHVAIVESVNPGVSITISEMNGYRFGGGFNRVGTGSIEWSVATSGKYLYIH